MMSIPDAPWVRDPERYSDEYYGESDNDDNNEEDY